MAKKSAARRRARTHLPTIPNKGPVVFLRAEDYMKRAETRREMAFFDHEGREVQVIHAFPVIESAIPTLLKEYGNGLNYHRVSPPPGWRVYALNWVQVQAFVAVHRAYAFDFFGYRSEKPPQPLKFRRKHAIRLGWERISLWGDEWGDWEIEPDIRYQVVFAERPISHIRAAVPKRDRASAGYR